MRFPNSDVSFRSGPHKKAENILDQIGLNYESERSFPPYTVDIYLPEWHIGVEIDGPQHSAKKDRKRDDYLLENYGLYLLRLKVKDGIDRDRVESQVLSFIDKHYEDSSERKRTWLTAL